MYKLCVGGGGLLIVYADGFAPNLKPLETKEIYFNPLEVSYNQIFLECWFT